MNPQDREIDVSKPDVAHVGIKSLELEKEAKYIVSPRPNRIQLSLMKLEARQPLHHTFESRYLGFQRDIRDTGVVPLQGVN
jgi:hypothetical protein